MPAPSFILALQLLSCAGFVRTLSAAGVVDAEPITLRKARPFAVIVFGFIGTLYSNITALKVSPMPGCPMPPSETLLPVPQDQVLLPASAAFTRSCDRCTLCAHASSVVAALCMGRRAEVMLGGVPPAACPRGPMQAPLCCPLPQGHCVEIMLRCRPP